MSSPDNIFKKAYATPSEVTDEYNDFSYSTIRTCFSQFLLLVGWKIEALDHRTFCFNKGKSTFKSQSVRCQITRQSSSVIVEMTCPYPEHFTHDDFESYVQLYTKDTENNTVSALAMAVWNYKPEIHIFQFLRQDYLWFKENFKNIQTQLAEINPNRLESLNQKMLFMRDMPEEIDFGKAVAHELSKNIFH